MGEVVEIELESDLDDDRYLTYEQYKEVLSFQPMYSKGQAYTLYAGITGFRPDECGRTKIEQLLFTDRNDPQVINKITKYKKKTYFDSKGRVISVKTTKTKKRSIPLWVRDYLEEYIRQHWMQMANGHLFPNGKGGYLNSDYWCVYWSRLRKAMTKQDSVRYAWVNENVCPKIVNGKITWTKRLSGYSFRKSRATWYAMACMEKGIQDVLLATAHFMGHGSKSIKATYVYIKKLIADRVDCGLEAIKPPDLNQNILGAPSPQREIDKIIKALLEDEELRKIILSKIKPPPPENL